VETQDGHSDRYCCSKNLRLVQKAPLHDEIKICALNASVVIAYVFLEGKKKFQPLCLIKSDTILQRINRRREYAVSVCRTVSGNFSVTASNKYLVNGFTSKSNKKLRTCLQSVTVLLHMLRYCP